MMEDDKSDPLTVGEMFEDLIELIHEAEEFILGISIYRGALTKRDDTRLFDIIHDQNSISGFIAGFGELSDYLNEHILDFNDAQRKVFDDMKTIRGSIDLVDTELESSLRNVYNIWPNPFDACIQGTATAEQKAIVARAERYSVSLKAQNNRK